MAKLTIFTSYTPGAGKSYYMVERAAKQKKNGRNVVVGFLNESHRDIVKILEDHKLTGYRKGGYSLDKILEQKPDLVIIDEMGMRGRNRDRRENYAYEDIGILLEKGVDVYTTVNLKRFERLNPMFKKETGIGIKNTIPDVFLERAETIYFIDREPEQMLLDYEQGNLFGSRYADSKIMKKNFERETLEAYRRISLEQLKNYSNVKVVKRK